MTHASMVTERLVWRPLDRFYKRVFLFGDCHLYFYLSRDMRARVFFLYLSCIMFNLQMYFAFFVNIHDLGSEVDKVCPLRFTYA